MIVVILSLLLIASITGNVLITRRALKINNTAYAGGLAVETCLDTINTAHIVVGKILDMPLAANDARVLQIHNELKRVHASLMTVAIRLAQSWNTEEEEKVPTSDTDQE